MTPPAYLEAARRARAAGGALDARAAQAIADALETYAAQLEAGLSRLSGRERRAAEQSATIIHAAAAQLEEAIAGAVSRGVTVSFLETLAVWRAATEAVGASKLPGALLGAVRVPPLTVVAAYEAVQPAATWRTLLREHVLNAASEANRIVREALVQRIPPTAVARALRPYVQGSEELRTLFPEGRIDIRKVPPELRGAAKRMRYNAERIAFSEHTNARAEAEVRHFQADPLVEAVRWTLSPNRGRAHVPDICDVLASQDLYGLGPGVYPVGKVPPSPHPFDRCERMPVVRDVEEAEEPKPDPPLQVAAARATIPDQDRLTPRGAERIREQLAGLLAT